LSSSPIRTKSYKRKVIIKNNQYLVDLSVQRSRSGTAKFCTRTKELGMKCDNQAKPT
jgi:hypothetical protein